MPTINDILRTIEAVAPLSLQESYDNAGLQIGDASAECTGAIICVDVTPETVSEAAARGCNLIISHHPLIFKGLKNITGATLQQRAAILAIKHDIAIYAAHTNLDNAPTGVSHTLAASLGIEKVSTLEPKAYDPTTGSGAIGDLNPPVSPVELVDRVKAACSSPVVRCSTPPHHAISRVAVCGGSGSFLINEAIKGGAQAFVTSDVKYHDFVDHGNDIFIIDIGHYESEKCTKQIFYHIVSEKFPNFALYYSELEKNPINYL